MASMLPEEKQEALQIIVLQSERLRNLAKKHGAEFIAKLLENVLYEARSALVGESRGPLHSEQADDARFSGTVVPLKRPAKPSGIN